MNNYTGEVVFHKDQENYPDSFFRLGSFQYTGYGTYGWRLYTLDGHDSGAFLKQHILDEYYISAESNL